LINIVNNYTNDGTGENQYILTHFRWTPGYEDDDVDDDNYNINSICATFNNFHKALIGLLSIAYRSKYISDNYHIYDEKTGKWQFQDTNDYHIHLNKTDSTDPLEILFVTYHGFEKIEYKYYDSQYYQRYVIEERKINFLTTSKVSYELKCGKLYKNDKLLNPQPKIMIEWLKQLTEHLTNNKNN
jgi:hypothetical protein